MMSATPLYRSLIAALLCTFVCGQQVGQVTPKLSRSDLLKDVEIHTTTNLPIINMGTAGTLLEDLQVTLSLANGSSNLELILTPATLVAEVDGKTMMQVNGGTYYDAKNKRFSSIGPF
eukprot:jgi/Picre1/29877/NNA_005259.t1